MGIERVVASPGSRSTALITAAATTPGIALDIQHDERVAAFVALGYGKGAQRPAVLICTSGSAGSHYLPAVLEGHYSGVPIMMLTADRPAELQGVGAPQTVDQSGFFSGYTRLTRLLPDIDVLGDGDMIDLARETYTAAVVGRGPVHVNWQFPEPLEPGNLRQGQQGAAESSHTRQPMAYSAIGLQPAQANAIGSADQLAFRHLLQVRRGFIVVGPDDHPPDARQLIFDFARNRGWPVFADIGSGLRTGGPPK
ncbi:MAG: 2-succinyl-5-enolpyruvyl-6-hydroxy-3-cyclohexene-1-carboxylic-acid synthase, partial [Acidimicrobiia bacterium]|nr:2-succinyl-5-enolpyruvyl-6-hydroxy-3-cyclohexene-1-carboxylic-acid synthase [Acidimicrobiia bacterium]